MLYCEFKQKMSVGWNFSHCLCIFCPCFWLGFVNKLVVCLFIGSSWGLELKLTPTRMAAVKMSIMTDLLMIVRLTGMQRNMLFSSIWFQNTRMYYTNISFMFRYTNNNRNIWGQPTWERSITCRNLLTDPELHSKLKLNHEEDPYYRTYEIIILLYVVFH